MGDWTSAPLLTRLMAAIESPWELDSKGFVHQETGERCTAEMRGPNKELPAAFRLGDDPERPSITDEVSEAIVAHRSVLRVRAAGDLRGIEALRALVSFGDGLVDAGATALWCPESGAARSAEAWKAVAERVELGSKKERMQGLFTAFVRPLVRLPSAWTTRGMVFLGVADVAVDPAVPEPLALDAIRLVCRRLLDASTPERLKARLGARSIEGSKGDDPTARNDPAFNPNGRWVLTLR